MLIHTHDAFFVNITFVIVYNNAQQILHNQFVHTIGLFPKVPLNAVHADTPARQSQATILEINNKSQEITMKDSKYLSQENGNVQLPIL